MSIDKVIQILRQYQYISIAAVVLFFVMVLLYIRWSRKRKYQKEFDRLEIRYNELVSIPVLFKINKANGLSKINPDVSDKVLQCKSMFDDISSRQEEISNLMADAEDAIAFSKLKQAKFLLLDLDELVTESLKLTYNLNESLESLLEQETRQRQEITELKDRFRTLKNRIMESTNALGDSYTSIEVKIKNIEHNFSVFEEWMFASDFSQAKAISDDTITAVADLEMNLTSVPKLYEIAKGVIPSLLDETSRSYQEAINQDVFLEHLEIPRNIAALSEILKKDLSSIANLEIEATQDSLIEIQKRLSQILVEIEKETNANQELNALRVDTFDNLDLINEDLKVLKSSAEKDEQRFNLDKHQEKLEAYQNSVNQFNDLRVKLERMIKDEKLPASSVLVSLEELKQDLEILSSDLKQTKDIVEQANADEIRAKNQLLKLYLIINDVQVRIKKRAVDSISDSYQEDLEQSYRYTNQIQNLLDEDVIEVKTLNATVSEAIDYIYKLHNNVNNLVGVVDMCENALVYANKFRAFVPDIDAELTRAELSFNNGQYTQALTTIINSIDRYRPNVAYEEMIMENAKSAY